MTTTKHHPLKIIWNIFSAISGAIGLSNVTSEFWDWIPFFEQLIALYKSIVYWPFMNFPQIPDWMKDYIFFGVLIGSSASKGFHLHKEGGFSVDKEMTLTAKIQGFIMSVIFIVPLWPIALIITLQHIPLGDKDKKLAMNTLKWLAAIFIIFISFLIVNMIAKNAP